MIDLDQPTPTDDPRNGRGTGSATGGPERRGSHGSGGAVRRRPAGASPLTPVRRLVLSVAAILVASAGVTSVLSVRDVRAARADAARLDAGATARAISNVIEPLLAQNDVAPQPHPAAKGSPAAPEPPPHTGLSTLRRLVAQSLHAGLEEVSVTLPDGQVVAHSEVSHITLRSLPTAWPAPADGAATPGRPDASTPDTDTATVTVTESVSLPGRGPLVVTVRPTPAPPVYLDSAALAPALVAALGVVAVLLAVRSAAGQMATLGLISAGLRSLGAALSSGGPAGGDRAPRTDGTPARPPAATLEVLQMDERFGPEAVAWNALLAAATDSGKEDTSPDTDAAPDAPRRTDRTGATSIAAARGLSMSDIEMAVNVLPTGVLILDREGRVRIANNMGSTLAGAGAEDIGGRLLTELFPDDPTIAELDANLRDQSAPRRAFEIKRQTLLGDTVIRVQCRPLRKDDVAAALITLDDVTQQRLADASRNLFIAQATHEIRTPLTNMRLALETVMDDGNELPPGMAPHLNMLSTEVRRLERLVSEMLAVSEIEAGSLKLSQCEVQLDRLVAELEHDHRPHATEKGLTLAFVLPPKYPLFYGDREKLAQALHNLVGNAIKYTPAAGPTGEPGRVTLTVSAEADSLSFAVADNGFGISADDQGKLFSRFARGSDPRITKITGTGLGLALSREIARLHGGDIALTSELNKGSTFTLTIPLGRSGADRMAA